MNPSTNSIGASPLASVGPLPRSQPRHIPRTSLSSFRLPSSLSLPHLALPTPRSVSAGSRLAPSPSPTRRLKGSTESSHTSSSSIPSELGGITPPPPHGASPSLFPRSLRSKFSFGKASRLTSSDIAASPPSETRSKSIFSFGSRKEGKDKLHQSQTRSSKGSSPASGYGTLPPETPMHVLQREEANTSTVMLIRAQSPSSPLLRLSSESTPVVTTSLLLKVEDEPRRSEQHHSQLTTSNTKPLPRASAMLVPSLPPIFPTPRFNSLLPYDPSSALDIELAIPNIDSSHITELTEPDSSMGIDDFSLSQLETAIVRRPSKERTASSTIDAAANAPPRDLLFSPHITSPSAENPFSISDIDVPPIPKSESMLSLSNLIVDSPSLDLESNHSETSSQSEDGTWSDDRSSTGELDANIAALLSPNRYESPKKKGEKRKKDRRQDEEREDTGRLTVLSSTPAKSKRHHSSETKRLSDSGLSSTGITIGMDRFSPQSRATSTSRGASPLSDHTRALNSTPPPAISRSSQPHAPSVFSSTSPPSTAIHSQSSSTVSPHQSPRLALARTQSSPSSATLGERSDTVSQQSSSPTAKVTKPLSSPFRPQSNLRHNIFTPSSPLGAVMPHRRPVHLETDEPSSPLALKSASPSRPRFPSPNVAPLRSYSSLSRAETRISGNRPRIDGLFASETGNLATSSSDVFRRSRRSYSIDTGEPFRRESLTRLSSSRAGLPSGESTSALSRSPTGRARVGQEVEGYARPHTSQAFHSPRSAGFASEFSRRSLDRASPFERDYGTSRMDSLFPPRLGTASEADSARAESTTSGFTRSSSQKFHRLPEHSRYTPASSSSRPTPESPVSSSRTLYSAGAGLHSSSVMQPDQLHKALSDMKERHELETEALLMALRESKRLERELREENSELLARSRAMEGYVMRLEDQLATRNWRPTTMEERSVWDDGRLPAVDEFTPPIARMRHSDPLQPGSFATSPSSQTITPINRSREHRNRPHPHNSATTTLTPSSSTFIPLVPRQPQSRSQEAHSHKLSDRSVSIMIPQASMGGMSMLMNERIPTFSTSSSVEDDDGNIDELELSPVDQVAPIERSIDTMDVSSPSSSRFPPRSSSSSTSAGSLHLRTEDEIQLNELMSFSVRSDES